MQYVVVEFRDDGVWIDPQPYLDRLAELSLRLPAGACQFVSEDGHYAFGNRCLHDMTFFPGDVSDGRAVFHGDRFKHDGDLEVAYRGDVVMSVDMYETADADAGTDMWDVIIDEVLPTSNGCVHEIVCHEGTVHISCSDLDVRWMDDEPI